MSDWDRIPTERLTYWARRCRELIQMETAGISLKKKPSAGDLKGIELQERMLTAITAELTRRENA